MRSSVVSFSSPLLDTRVVTSDVTVILGELLEGGGNLGCLGLQLQLQLQLLLQFYHTVLDAMPCPQVYLGFSSKTHYKYL